MKARTMILMAGTVGAGAAVTRMMRRRGDEHETAEHKAKRPGWRRMAGLVGTGIAFRAMRRQNAQGHKHVA